MKLLKILYITTTYPTADTESTGFFLTNITTALPKDKINITILTLSHDGKYKNYKDIYENEVIQIPYSFILPPLLKQGGLLNCVKLNPLAIFQIIIFYILFCAYVIKNSKKYDIIHGHWVLTGGFIACITKYFHKKPIVVTAHGAEYYLDKNFFVKFMLNFCYKRLNFLIFVSKYLMEKAIDWNLPLPENKAVIYNCVNIDKFKPDSKLKLKNKDFTFVIVKRLSLEKRIIDVLQATKILFDKNIKDFKVWIIGHGPEYDNLIKFIADNNLKNIVKMYGYVENTQVPSLLQQADIYINPSVQEGFATTNVESQSVGLPAISSIGCGSEEIFTQDINGLFFKPKDYKDLSLKMEYILNNKDKVNQMSKNSRQIVEDNFSSKIIAQKYVNLYESVYNKFYSK